MKDLFKKHFPILIVVFCVAAGGLSVYIPPYPRDPTKFLNGNAQWTVPAGGGTGSVSYASVTNALSLTGSSTNYLRSDGTQASPPGDALTRAAVTNVLGVSVDESGNIVTPGTITSLAPGPTVVTNLVMATNTASRVQYLDATGSVQSVTHTGIVLGTGAQYPSGSYTVAGLPAAASYPGLMVYCSDTITVDGVGGTVASDGVNWLHVTSGIPVTTDIWQHMVYLASYKYKLTTAKTTAHFSDRFVPGSTTSYDLWGGFTVSGGAADAGEENGVSFASIEAGTSASGRTFVANEQWTPTAGEYLSCFARVRAPTLSDVTDKFWIFFGTCTSATTVLGSGSNGFLYDLWNTTSHGSLLTNNWLTVKRIGSSTTPGDSGVTVNAGTWVTLGYQMFYTNEVRLWINGTCIATNNNVSPEQQFTAVSRVVRTEGTTADKGIQVDWIQLSRRFSTARTNY